MSNFNCVVDITGWTQGTDYVGKGHRRASCSLWERALRSGWQRKKKVQGRSRCRLRVKDQDNHTAGCISSVPSNKMLHVLKIQVLTKVFTIDIHSSVVLRVPFHSTTTKNSTATLQLPQIHTQATQTPVDPPMTPKTSSALSKQRCRLKKGFKVAGGMFLGGRCDWLLTCTGGAKWLQSERRLTLILGGQRWKMRGQLSNVMRFPCGTAETFDRPINLINRWKGSRGNIKTTL